MSDLHSVDDGLRANPALAKEYDSTFTGEEKVTQALQLDREGFSLHYQMVNLMDLSSTEPIKKGRKDTYLGLSTSINELGILSPIHVMMTEGYSDWLEERESKMFGMDEETEDITVADDFEEDKDEEDGLGVHNTEDYEGIKYVVVDGFRRVYAALKNGITECQAVVWNFKDKDAGSQLVTTLSGVLNKTQKHSWNEIWHLHQILELQSSMTPGTLEYLLNLAPGDAMKLKDIMLCEYEDVIDALVTDKKDLTQSYNMLQKLRKEEDQLLKDDGKGIGDVDEAETLLDGGDSEDGDSEDDGKKKLSDEEVKEILDMGMSDGDLDDEDFDELMGNNLEADRFEVDGDRHLDPALRAAVLGRDEYKCQVTGFGEGLPAEVALAVLQVHHKIPVACGGTNDMENLITLSQDPHTLVHVIQRRGGRLNMPKDEYEKLPEHMQTYMREVMKLAKIAVEADRRCGKTKEQVKKDTSDAMRFDMPGKIYQENKKAIEGSK